MKYLCLGYLDEKAFDALPEHERKEILDECFAMCEPFRATGKVIYEESLQSSGFAKTIRTQDGRVAVTDGPYIEAREQLGSFFIIEAETLEEAIEVASMHPAARMGEQFGFGLELHPFQ